MLFNKAMSISPYFFLENGMWKIYEGDLFLFAVDTEYEADEARDLGFTVVFYTKEIVA